MKTKTTLAVLAVVAALAAPALANGELNDLEIAHTAYTAGQIDIRYAHLALAISDNESVRRFAQTMIRDHTAVNEAAGALVAKLNVTPEDNELSQALIAGAAAKRSAMQGLTSEAFDCAYAENELAYHRLVNKTVAERFIPNATVPELKVLLTDALVTFRQHEGHAETMVAGLKCAS